MCLGRRGGRKDGEYLRVACANDATTKTMSGSSPDDNTLSDRAINELDVCVFVCVPKGLMCVLPGLGTGCRVCAGYRGPGT